MDTFLKRLAPVMLAAPLRGSERGALTLWLLVAVMQDYICGVVDACSEILHWAFAKLVDPEDKVVHICDPVYVVLKDVDAEGVEQVWNRHRRDEQL